MTPSPSARPYRLLACFYDQLTPYAPAMNRHARRRILGAILRHARSVCDLACGTGETALDFARRGRRVFAVDLSPALCRITRAKARRQKLRVRVFCADMRSFRLPEPVDLVSCEFSALNHVPRKADLDRVVRAVARALRPGGWFLFDVNTCSSLAEQYTTTSWEEKREFKLVLRGRYNARRRKAWNILEWFLPQGKLWRHRREQVENVCWTDAEIRRALGRAGFKRIRSWDGLEVRPRLRGARRGYDAYYLAQKPRTKRAG